jgi:hypothetical protein
MSPNNGVNPTRRRPDGACEEFAVGFRPPRVGLFSNC